MPIRQREKLENIANKDIERVTGKSKEKSQLIQYNIRLEQNDIDKLKAHFESKGLSMSSGIRMIIREYLNSI